MAKKNLLIEVYTEELPPSCVVEFDTQLKFVVNKVFNDYRINFDSFESYVTPVRIVVLACNVEEETRQEITEIIGPSVNIAIKNGNFTPAAIGFAKKYGVELKELFIKETQKGKFLAIKKIVPSENIKKIVSNLVFSLLSNLSYPKNMVWEETKFLFPRPIRNLLVIYGNEIIKTKFLSLKSTDFTFGIKTYPLKKIKIVRYKKHSLTEAYLQALKEECIILDPGKRYEVLIKSIENIANRKGLIYDNDKKLLNEITSIVEYPTCILCEFPEKFLQLPKEFIITCMKTKQKFIPLYNTEGNLKNMFIGVKNGSSEHLSFVKEGFQKVLIARLEDVEYYYNTDRKIEYNLYFEKLKGIIYNDKLNSSYYDKVIRIKELAKYLNKQLQLGVDEDIINITSTVIKNDLVTQIVYEYPELQGIAGRIYCAEYCKNKSLPDEIAQACEEHLMPKNFDDIVPKSLLSVVFSLSDKLSTVIDQTIIDNLPTGSSDPLGLKKTMDAVIKICLEKKYDIDLYKIFEFYSSLISKDMINLYNKFLEFVVSRYESILLNFKYNIDEIKTVLFKFNGEFYTKSLIISALSNFRKTDNIIPFVEAYKRSHNILQQGLKKKMIEKNDYNVDTNLFSQLEEKELYKFVLELKDEIDELYNLKYFDKILLKLVELKPVIDKFFDKVLVFDNNFDVAKNRLRLINFILVLFHKIGALENLLI